MVRLADEACDGSSGPCTEDEIGKNEVISCIVMGPYVLLKIDNVCVRRVPSGALVPLICTLIDGLYVLVSGLGAPWDSSVVPP